MYNELQTKILLRRRIRIKKYPEKKPLFTTYEKVPTKGSYPILGIHLCNKRINEICIKYVYREARADKAYSLPQQLALNRI